MHINLLELKAIILALQALCNPMQNHHIKILSDNTTAVSYIRNMGGTKSSSCNDITREVFMWCIDRKLTLSISHLPGKLNTEANKASREFHNSNTEWSLDQTAFNELKLKLGEPDVDMFASRLNHKTPNYIAWRPDPGAVAIDAFTVDLSKYKLIYCFPPFSLISKVLQSYPREQNISNPSLPTLANAVLVSTSAPVNEISSSNNQDAQEDSHVASSARGSSPSVPQTSASWMSCVKSFIINQGITGEPLNTILES